MCTKNFKASKEQIIDNLNGIMTPLQRRMMKELFTHLDELNIHISGWWDQRLYEASGKAIKETFNLSKPPELDKDNDMRRKSKYNLQFVATKRNFSPLSVAFTSVLQYSTKSQRYFLSKLWYNINYPTDAALSWQVGGWK